MNPQGLPHTLLRRARLPFRHPRKINLKYILASLSCQPVKKGTAKKGTVSIFLALDSRKIETVPFFGPFFLGLETVSV